MNPCSCQSHVGTVFKMGPRLKLEGKRPRPAVDASAQFKVPVDFAPECLVLAPVSVPTTPDDSRRLCPDDCIKILFTKR